MAICVSDGPGSVPASSLYGVLALLILLHAPWTTAQAVTVDEVGKEVARNYERFRAIKNLTLRWTLRYEHMKGRRKFGFDSVDVKSLRKGDRLRLGMIARMPNGFALIREMAWDGKTGTTKEQRSNRGGDFTITARPFHWLYQYNYFMNFLSYPDGAGALPSLANSYGRDDAGGWLPEAITSSAGEYRASEQVDDEGVRCVVVERSGSNAFWFDPEKGFALRRRDAWDSENGSLRTRTVLRDFRLVDGFWLPALVVREEFGGTDDLRSVPGEVSARKVVQVTEISTGPVADQEFVLRAPDGVAVHDSPRRTYFHPYRSGENPIIDGAETLRVGNPSFRRTPLLAVVAILLGVVDLALLALWIRFGVNARREPANHDGD